MEYSFTSLLDLIGAFLLGMFVADKIIFYRIRKALEEAGVDFEEGEESVQVVTVKKYFVEMPYYFLNFIDVILHSNH